MSGVVACSECGMPCDPAEYHPYAACLMFKGCHNSATVRANLAPLAAATARAEAAERERNVLRAFAQDVMEDWNEGDLDGGTRQDLAERHGLIAPIERFAPCGEECVCSEFFTERDWADGQQCYHVTTLLTGKPESEAAIAAQQAEGE